MEEISVVISYNEALSMKRPEMMEAYVIGRLRDAGIPVKGVLLFGGVECGEITQEQCPYTKDIIFTWRDLDPSYEIGDNQEVCKKCLVHEMFFTGGGSWSPDFCPNCYGEDYVMFKDLSWWKKRKANKLFKKMLQRRTKEDKNEKTNGTCNCRQGW
jgi:hypothetical protein